MKAAALTAALCAVLLTGCERDGGSDGPQVNVPGIESLPAKPGDVVAEVNGQPITGALVELYSISRQQQHPTGKPPQPRELTDEVINLELLSEQAAREGLHQRSDIATELYFQRINLLANAMMERWARQANIGDAQVEQRYRERYPGGQITEYRTRQILVEDRASARNLIQQIVRGADFADLARQHSKGPAAAQGGALEWFRPDNVLPEFAAAVAALEPGQYTKTPVRTTYGWHVILLEEQRRVPAPTLDEAAPDIVRTLVTEHLEQRLDELRAKAEIQYRR